MIDSATLVIGVLCLALAAAVIVLSVTGAIEDNPCERLATVKPLIIVDEEDGKQVTVDGEQRVCQDGEAVRR